MQLTVSLIKYAFYTLQFYFIFYTYYLFLSVLLAGAYKIKRKKAAPATDKYARIAIMLPAYKASPQFLNVVEACLTQKYPREQFDVFALMQHCPSEIMISVKEKGAIALEKNFDDCNGNPYLHALNYFIQAIEKYDKYDAILLVDKDNLLSATFLDIINRRFQQGHVAIQGRRRPLNLDTSAACFDHIAEASNDMMLRAAKAALGLSVEISGSGMAFEFGLYKKAIAAVDLQSPVHDKTFLLELIKQHTSIFFEPEAILYEEKTASYQAISQQRTRWIGGQVYLCKKYFFKLLAWGFKQQRPDPIDYAFTLFKIPRSIHVVGLVFWICFAFVLPGFSFVSFWQWLFYLTGYFTSIIILLLLDGTPPIVYKALFRTPVFAFNMMKSAVRSISKKNQGSFIHTEHSKIVSLKELTKKQ